MNHTKKLLLLLSVLALLLAACGQASPAPESTAPNTETVADTALPTGESAAEPSGLLGQTAEPNEAEYAGYQFSGQDPWGGSLSITILNLSDGKLDWSFTDSFENHTLYQVQKGTLLQEGKADFDLQGKDVEQPGGSFSYQGSLELRESKLIVSFLSGAVTAEDGSVSHDAAALSGEAQQVVLERNANGPYMTYVVQAGDSVHSIAQAHGISTKDLCILNQIVIMETAKSYGYEFEDVTEYAKYLFPGEELLVPKQ